MKANELYVVTSGSYSDYGVDAIFDKKELAQAFIKSFSDGNDFNDIEVYALNPFEPEIKQGLKAYFVRINKDGETDPVEHLDNAYGFNEGDMLQMLSFTHNKDRLNVRCFAKDTDHAIKIANEKRAKIIALDRWGDNGLKNI